MTVLTEIHEAMEGVEHAVQNGAAWLIGAYQIAQKNILDAVESDSLVAEAANIAKTWAVGHGTLVQSAQNVADSILSLAKQIAGTTPSIVAAPAQPADAPIEDAASKTSEQ